jgi:hypothetical protein
MTQREQSSLDSGYELLPNKRLQLTPLSRRITSGVLRKILVEFSEGLGPSRGVAEPPRWRRRFTQAIKCMDPSSLRPASGSSAGGSSAASLGRLSPEL